jgi:hypothetical protein
MTMKRYFKSCRFVAALFACLFLAGVRVPASAQVLGRAANVCGDGSRGASVVAQSPIAISDGNIMNVLIFLHSTTSDAYVQELKYFGNVPRIDSVEAAHDLEGHTTRLTAAMGQVYSHALFAQTDSRGAILCGGVAPGQYDLIAIAQMNSISAVAGSSSVRYYLSHANVPQTNGARSLVRASPFSALY